MPPLLELAGLARAFGTIRAVDGVDLRFERPGIYGLIGPNGAGKTTLFDLIAGRQTADRGEIRHQGARIDQLPVHRRARRGFARSFQECRVLTEATLLENLLFAAQDKRLGPSLLTVLTRRSSARQARDEAMALLDLVNLTRFADRPAAALSYGQRRLLEIACSLMTRPALLLLDEPAAGINPTLINTLTDLLRRIFAERGITLLIVEHNMPFIMELAAEIVVMHQGRVLAQGAPEAIRANPQVIEAYLG
jgi:ABC-type branched-subunit amino acid transport system ATPase component